MVLLSELTGSAPPSEPSRLDLGLRLFLSHSGADKPFTRSLSRRLEEESYSVFLDEKSLYVGHVVDMTNILLEVEDCDVAVFVISEDFFMRTKNPMLELVASVKARKRLLPLFFGLTVSQFKERGRRDAWERQWAKWVAQKDHLDASSDHAHLKCKDVLRVNISEWKDALQLLASYKGIERQPHDCVETYMDLVVSEIQQMIPNDLGHFDSYVEGKEEWTKIVSTFLNHTEPCSALGDVQVAGIYGMSGLGKTTLCKVLCNYYYQEFGGKVCHLQLRTSHLSPSITTFNDQSELDNMRHVLKHLTKVPKHLLQQVTDLTQARSLLKRFIRKTKVFFALDNVVDKCLTTVADMYLEHGFCSGSKIVILGRSAELLISILRRYHARAAHAVFPMPPLSISAAQRLLMVTAGVPSPAITPTIHELEEARSIISRLVPMCAVDAGEHSSNHDNLSHHPYMHPLLLISIGNRLRHLGNLQLWLPYVKILQSSQRCQSNRFHDDQLEDVLGIIPVLRSSFDTLTPQCKMIFLDIALFAPQFECEEGNIRNRSMFDWLCWIHGIKEDNRFKMFLQLHELRQASLLPLIRDVEVNDVLNTSSALNRRVPKWEFTTYHMPDYDVFKVHDLHKIMAVVLAKENCQLTVYRDRTHPMAKSDLWATPIHGYHHLTRLGLVNCVLGLEGHGGYQLDLSCFPCLEVVRLLQNEGLEVVKIGSNNSSLLSLEVQAKTATLIIQGFHHAAHSLRWLCLVNASVEARKRKASYSSTSDRTHRYTPGIWCISDAERAARAPAAISGRRMVKRHLAFTDARYAGLDHFDTIRRCGRIGPCGLMPAYSVPSIKLGNHLSNLKSLSLNNIHDGLQHLTGFHSSMVIERIHISRCIGLESILGLDKLRHLFKVSLDDCPSLESFSSLNQQIVERRAYSSLEVHKCPKLWNFEIDFEDRNQGDDSDIHTPPNFPEVVQVHVSSEGEMNNWVSWISTLNFAYALELNVQNICFSDDKLNKIFHSLKYLNHFSYLGCTRTSDCQKKLGIINPDLGCLKYLASVTIECECIEDISSLNSCEDLVHITLVGCYNIKKWPRLANLKNITDITLHATPVSKCLKELFALETSAPLKALVIDCCILDSMAYSTWLSLLKEARHPVVLNALLQCLYWKTLEVGNHECEENLACLSHDIIDALKTINETLKSIFLPWIFQANHEIPDGDELGCSQKEIGAQTLVNLLYKLWVMDADYLHEAALGLVMTMRSFVLASRGSESLQCITGNMEDYVIMQQCPEQAVTKCHFKEENFLMQMRWRLLLVNALHDEDDMSYSAEMASIMCSFLDDQEMCESLHPATLEEIEDAIDNVASFSEVLMHQALMDHLHSCSHKNKFIKFDESLQIILG